MPNNHMNFSSAANGRPGPHNSCESSGVIDSSAALVNAVVVPEGETRSKWRTPAYQVCSTKSPSLENGYINHGCNDWSREPATLETKTKQGHLSPSITDALRAVRLSSADGSDGVSVNGDVMPEDLISNLNQTLQGPNSPAPKKKRRKRVKKPKYIKSQHYYCAENSTPPQEEEEWDNDLQEATSSDWENQCFGVSPYGPEDILPFPLRGLTLDPWDTAVVAPLRTSYKPASLHPHCIKWRHYSRNAEPDQFEDAQE